MGAGGDLSYDTSNFEEEGGARTVIGGELDILSGGEVDFESGSTIKIDSVATDRLVKVAKITLASATGDAGVFSWQNPEASAILVIRFLLDVTTEATGAALIDVGSDADGTGTSDDLLDGADIGTAAGVFDNVDDQGTNGQSIIRLDANGGTTDYITGSASADPAGLVGSAYVVYVVV